MKPSQRHDRLQTVTVRKEKSFHSSAWLQLFSKQAINNTKRQWLHKGKGEAKADMLTMRKSMVWIQKETRIKLQGAKGTGDSALEGDNWDWPDEEHIARTKPKPWPADSPLPCQLGKPRVEMANQNSNTCTLGEGLRGYMWTYVNAKWGLLRTH